MERTFVDEKTVCSMLSVRFHTGPITALEIVDDFVFAGVGGHLQIYDLNQQQQQQQQQQEDGQHDAVLSSYVLPCRNVHGIRLKQNDDTFCVFGEKVVRVLQLSRNEERKRPRVKFCSDVFEAEDWIWEVSWLTDGSGDELALALGHNVILHWKWTTGEVMHRLDCSEKCILYSAHFINQQWSNLVLAAGTVFNQVVLWSACTQQTDQGQCPVLHRLAGHQGVIFAIDYSPSTQRICSASDDRSIRVWQLRVDSDWTRVDSTLLHTLFGHTARVWGVRFLLDHLVSVGEDSLCCVWNTQGSITHTFKGHKGRSIRSLAVSGEKGLVVTGGGDNSIRVWHTNGACETGSHATTSEMLIPEQMPIATELYFQDDCRPCDFLSAALCLLQVSKTDFVRNVALLDFDTLLLVTHDGMVYVSDVNKPGHCQLVCQSADLQSYSLLAVNNNRHLAAIGSISGSVWLLWKDQGRQPHSVGWLQLSVYTGKVLGLAWVDNDVLLTTGPDGVMHTLQVGKDGGSVTMAMVATLSLPACKQRWAMAGVLLASGAFLLCGDRGGTVHWYRLPASKTGEPWLPLQSFPRIHGKAGVTDARCHGNKIITSGRDGHIRHWMESEGRLRLVSSRKVAKKLEWIAGLLEYGGNLCLAAFCSSQFLLWGLAGDVCLLQVDCGGGHRSWDCCLHGNQARFVFLKARSVVLHNASIGQGQTILKPPLHGRELTDVLHISSVRESSGSLYHLLVTGSEDTTLNVSVLCQRGTEPWTLRPLHTLQGHLSSVRTLTTCNHCAQKRATLTSQQQGKASSILLFSGGGRAQLLVWQLTLQGDSQSTAARARESGVGIPGRLDLTDAQQTSYSGRESCENSSAAACSNDQVPREKKSMGDSQQVQAECGGRSIETSKTAGEGLPTPNLSDSTVVVETREKETGCSSVQAPLQCSGVLYGGVSLASDRPPHRGYKPWRSRQMCADPETRVMCLTAFCAQELSDTAPSGLYFIAAACSDGFVKLFGFHEEEKTFTLLKQSSFHDCCLLKVSHLIQRSDHGVLAILMSSATDGKIAFWDAGAVCLAFLNDRKPTEHQSDEKSDSDEDSVCDKNSFVEENHCCREKASEDSSSADELGANRVCHSARIQRAPAQWAREDNSEWKPVAEVKVHQSGVNSLHAHHVQGSEYLLASGGDDNALTVCSVRLLPGVASPVQISVWKVAEELSAHAAQITGVRVLRRDLIFSASIDQRLCLWKLKKDDAGFSSKLQMISCLYTHVSDIANISAWRLSQSEGESEDVSMAICGEGLSMIDIHVPSSGKN